MQPIGILKPEAAITGALTSNGRVDGAIAAWPDPLAREALHGLAGEFVETVIPHSEADPAAFLIQFLIAFGNVVGRSAHYVVEEARHSLNLFGVLVGTTSKGRKGTSWNRVLRRFAAVDADWVKDRVSGGLSSGEGLISKVRDPVQKLEPIRGREQRVKEYQKVIVDEGESDKRLLVVEEEFSSPLQVARREGNTLSPLIRRAWDTGMLASMTRNNPLKATDAHVSIIGHITKQELLRHLDSTETANGFANRFLWFCTRRSKSLPDGGHAHELDWNPFDAKLTKAVRFGRGVGQIARDNDSRKLWHAVYPKLSEGQPGLLGAVISRAEAQVLRLACVYALLDCSSIIMPEHLKAALAVWEYAEASARFVFGNALGDPVADDILRALRASATGLTRTEIRDLFGRNKTGTQIQRALALLQEHALADFRTEESGGRSAEIWFALRPTTGAEMAGSENPR